MMSLSVLDGFAGAGGFSLGAHQLTDDVIGIELDKDAVATQLAAGMRCEQVDITTVDPLEYERPGHHLHTHYSPPCQSFSAAGKGKGRQHIELLQHAVADILLHGKTWRDLTDIDATTLLVLEPAKWIYALQPESVSLEQVRSVLPIWEAYADAMDEMGYRSWTSLLHSEQYGVPQTRTRAWLGASFYATEAPVAPTPTHSRYHVRKPERLDEGVLPWVSMATALGWGMTQRGSYTVTGGGTSTGGAEPFANGARKGMSAAEAEGRWTHMMQGGAGGEGRPRPAEHPAPTQSAKGTATVTDDPDNNWHGKENKAARVAAAAEAEGRWTHLRMGQQKRQAVRAVNRPAATFAFGHDAARTQFTNEPDNRSAPATTIQGDSRVWPRGHKINQADIDRLGEEEAKAKYGDRAGTHARRITVEEAGILQGFPADFPWQGSKTSQFRQVGNAVNPQVALAVLESVL